MENRWPYYEMKNEIEQFRQVVAFQKEHGRSVYFRELARQRARLEMALAVYVQWRERITHAA